MAIVSCRLTLPLKKINTPEKKTCEDEHRTAYGAGSESWTNRSNAKRVCRGQESVGGWPSHAFVCRVRAQARRPRAGRRSPVLGGLR